MGKPTGFLDTERESLHYRDREERLKDFKQVAKAPSEAVSYTHLTLPTIYSV